MPSTKSKVAELYAPYSASFVFQDRVDTTLVRDFVLRTCIPFETGLIGYATLEKILYATATRFGEAAKPLVRPLLEALAKEDLIIAGPHRDAWRLA
jgi:hypothetical protein